MSDFLTGKSLGRYQILEKIGQGGMAIVYKAHDPTLDRDVAIKVIRSGAFPAEQHEKILKRFEREARSMANLSHPSIIKILDSSDYEGSPYLVMEYLPGDTLKKNLGQPMPWRDATKLLVPIARGLSYAHSRGIIHRDVKPSNILFNGNGDPILSDFGIAKLLDLEEGQTLTDSGVGIGTPEYMAPEQGKGESIDARADIYALGIVLFELVTGKKPFTADTPMKVVIKHVTEPLPRPSKFVPDLPQELEGVLLKALAKLPEDRYADMDAFTHALEKLLSGEKLAQDETAATIMQDDDSQATVDLYKSDQIKKEVPQEKPADRSPGDNKKPWLIGGSIAAAGVVGLICLIAVINLLVNGSGGGGTAPTYPTDAPGVSWEPSNTPRPQPTSPPDQPTYTPYPTYTPRPTETNKPSPTKTTQVINSDSSCSTVSWSPKFQVGDRVRICTIYRLILRDRVDGNEIIALFWDNYVNIIDGPKCGQDAWWWKIEVAEGAKYSSSSTASYESYNFTNRTYTGWVKAGLNRDLLPDSNGYYLCP